MRIAHSSRLKRVTFSSKGSGLSSTYINVFLSSVLEEARKSTALDCFEIFAL